MTSEMNIINKNKNADVFFFPPTEITVTAWLVELSRNKKKKIASLWRGFFICFLKTVAMLTSLWDVTQDSQHQT